MKLTAKDYIQIERRRWARSDAGMEVRPSQVFWPSTKELNILADAGIIPSSPAEWPEILPMERIRHELREGKLRFKGSRDPMKLKNYGYRTYVALCRFAMIDPKPRIKAVK